MKQLNYIIDCDGVLYPQSDVPLADIVQAMKNVYRDEVKVSGAEQQRISEQTLNAEHLGIFNYILEICRYKNYDFDKFCAQITERIDYTKIDFNPQITEQLMQAANRTQVIIFSNNSYAHIDQVLRRVCRKSAADLQSAGVQVYDIAASQRDGYFHPKQSANGFKYFLENTGLKGAECVLLDDAPGNLRAASRHKIKGVLINEDNTLLGYLARQNNGLVWSKTNEQTR